ncbi:hypothetical protein, partial [Staphylococcus xylosus]|uniref:hypothetical protein n=1 Tax=Staphylococcus xylosus TaxID=1288 RepID=UPI000D4885B9
TVNNGLIKNAVPSTPNKTKINFFKTSTPLFNFNMKHNEFIAKRIKILTYTMILNQKVIFYD